MKNKVGGRCAKLADAAPSWWPLRRYHVPPCFAAPCCHPPFPALLTTHNCGIEQHSTLERLSIPGFVTRRSLFFQREPSRQHLWRMAAERGWQDDKERADAAETAEGGTRRTDRQVWGHAERLKAWPLCERAGAFVRPDNVCASQPCSRSPTCSTPAWTSKALPCSSN